MRVRFKNHSTGGFDLVRIRLTKAERRELWRAHLLSLFLPVCAAMYMSEELESLVCGHTPHRYELLEIGYP